LKPPVPASTFDAVLPTSSKRKRNENETEPADEGGGEGDTNTSDDKSGGGWKVESKVRERGSVGDNGGKDTYVCKYCRLDLPTSHFNAKKLNGVRRGWVKEEEISCKNCNFLVTRSNDAPVRGGPLSRDKLKKNKT